MASKINSSIGENPCTFYQASLYTGRWAWRGQYDTRCEYKESGGTTSPARDWRGRVIARAVDALRNRGAGEEDDKPPPHHWFSLRAMLLLRSGKG